MYDLLIIEAVFLNLSEYICTVENNFEKHKEVKKYLRKYQ